MICLARRGRESRDHGDHINEVRRDTWEQSREPTSERVCDYIKEPLGISVPLGVLLSGASPAGALRERPQVGGSTSSRSVSGSAAGVLQT